MDFFGVQMLVVNTHIAKGMVMLSHVRSMKKCVL
jgi:hypothetical protein